MSGLVGLKKEMAGCADPVQAALLQRFFKTGPGEYGEGDIFLGIKVPAQRSIAKRYPELSFSELRELLASNIHEYRLSALFTLIAQYKKGDNHRKKEVFDFYLKNIRSINNWDLVDLSAPQIIGDFLIERPRKLLYDLADSKNLWERRIAIISTFVFIRKGEFDDTFILAEKLLDDRHDLIHKAVGWMLREVGKREHSALIAFLDQYYKVMPRTMLRYAIEKLNENERKYYMDKKNK